MKLTALAVVLGLALSTGVAACPKDEFQEQRGSFRWMVSGSFNGQNFQYRGQGPRNFRVMLRQLLREYRETRGERRIRRGGRGFGPVAGPT